MKKGVLVLIGMMMSYGVFAQKMMTKTGEIKFEASVPAFEPVAATNSTVSCIFDGNSGEIAALALIKAFKFKIPLMEEHFNENYMESSKYPKATFKGGIMNFNASKLTSAKTTYDLVGDMTIHGVTKKIKAKIILAKSGDKFTAVSNLVLKPQDYNIQIPSLVKEKIAENVNVAINFLLEPKQ